MMFGLVEEDGEQLADKVSRVLEEVGVKPRFEACRLPDKARPVKLTLQSFLHVLLLVVR